MERMIPLSALSEAAAASTSAVWDAPPEIPRNEHVKMISAVYATHSLLAIHIALSAQPPMTVLEAREALGLSEQTPLELEISKQMLERLKNG